MNVIIRYRTLALAIIVILGLSAVAASAATRNQVNMMKLPHRAIAQDNQPINDTQATPPAECAQAGPECPVTKDCPAGQCPFTSHKESDRVSRCGNGGGPCHQGKGIQHKETRAKESSANSDSGSSDSGSSMPGGGASTPPMSDAQLQAAFVAQLMNNACTTAKVEIPRNDDGTPKYNDADYKAFALWLFDNSRGEDGNTSLDAFIKATHHVCNDKCETVFHPALEGLFGCDCGETCSTHGCNHQCNDACLNGFIDKFDTLTNPESDDSGTDSTDN